MHRPPDPTHPASPATEAPREPHRSPAEEGERPAVPAEPRQRWRLTVAREVVPADQVGRAALEAWQVALERSGLPIAGLDVPGGRPRLAFGAPLPAGARGEAELVEVWLLERLPLWRVRAALGETLPAGYHWVRAEDVWLGAPALAGQVAGADWAVTVATVEGDEAIDRARLSDAVAAVMGADSIQRTRGKPGAEKPYDLRPLLVSVEVEEGSPDQTGPAAARSGSIRLRMRTRLDPERGTGRPEEVVAALAEVAGIGLEIVELVRSRLLLASEPLD